ncbi:MAG: ABC transporter ATP-binding protein [Nostoc sp.]|uniref:ABC transporter ATP-binding protein n=1 Tax=Nostoc sp. TaxID=1180 RepID=UPI002FFCFE0A
MSAPIIAVRNLNKSYRLYSKPADRLKELLMPWRTWHSSFFALQDISFDLQPTEHLGIIGMNGAGKSTLLQILAGVLTPTSGTVEINGRVSALLELGAGFNPELTGRENVDFLATTLNSGNKITKDAIDKIINFADIGEFINQPVKTYSSGMFVRLAFAINIIHAPDILIIDEALAVGDILFQQKCMRSLTEFCTQGTVLFVSHDPSSVKKICTKALWLERGRIREYGDAKEVCDRYVGAANEAFGRTYIENIPEVKVDQHTSNLVQAPDDILGKTKIKIDLLSNVKAGLFEKYDCIGTREAEILDASFEKIDESDSVMFTGNELCRLVVYVRSLKELPNGVVGFIVKDKLGQYILGTNSFDWKLLLNILVDRVYAVVFEFNLPKIANGIYTIDLAIAEGDVNNYRQLHWVYDALQFGVERLDYRGVMIEPLVDSVYLID